MEAQHKLIGELKKYYSGSKFSKAFFYVLTFVALVVAFQHYYIIVAHNSSRFTLTWHILFNLFYWWCWLGFLPLIKLTNEKFGDSSAEPVYWTVVYFILPVGIVATHQVISALVIHAVLGIYTDLSLIYKRLLTNSWIWVDLVVYFVILFGLNAEKYRKKNLTFTLKLNQLRSRLVQSQLNALRSQIHPHFLFNTLNTLSTLILKENNQEADRMLFLLNNFLKTTVYERHENEISLNEELNFVNDYLEIELVRFKDKLTVKHLIDSPALNAKVPGFLLQPLIENAIHYAIAPKRSGGIIKITAAKKRERLIINIEDNGPGLNEFKKKKNKEGVGLKITKERLLYLFGRNHRFELKDSSMGGLSVIIDIPFYTGTGSNNYKVKKLSLESTGFNEI